MAGSRALACLLRDCLRLRHHHPTTISASSPPTAAGTHGLTTITRCDRTSWRVSFAVRPGYVTRVVTVTIPTGQRGLPLTAIERERPTGSSDGPSRSCSNTPPGDDVVSFSPQIVTDA